MEMKLRTHVCNIISMTTTLFEQQQIASGNILKHFNSTTHGDGTWYTCVLHHFHHDCRLLTIASGTFLLVACIEVKLGPLVQNAYVCKQQQTASGTFSFFLRTPQHIPHPHPHSHYQAKVSTQDHCG